MSVHFQSDSLSHLFPVKQIRIHRNWNRCQKDQSYRYNFKLSNRQKSNYDLQNTAQHPNLSCKPVRSIPVLRITQCPWQLDTNCIILAAFRQIVADDNEYHTEQQIGHKIDIHPWPVQSRTINRNPHKNRNNRANPKHQSINLTADISPSWINACNNGSEPMAGEYNKINKCHAPQFALVRISYAFTIKMHRYLFRQLMPQKQSHQYRQ